MRTVAFLSATRILGAHPGFEADRLEHERELSALQPACAARGIELRPLAWDDPRLERERPAAWVIGTAWDYAERPAEFLAALERLAARAPLLNPLPVVRWNLEKGYLADLAARGVPVVPTLWRPRADAPTIAAAFDELGVLELVVKPRVGASSWRQSRVRRGAPLPPADELPPGEALIQPFLPAVEREGELSFVFAGGTFSHCVRKRPRAGDYRVQSSFGASDFEHAPDDAELALARRVLAAVDGPLLYARVDMMRGPAGGLVVMELELIEPYLYPLQGPDLGPAFAAALERALGG